MTLDDLPEAAVPQNNVAVQVLAPVIPIMGVEVFGQDVPFGGVQVIVNDETTQVDFGGNGSGGNFVTSVFGRIGDVVALCSDYNQCYQPRDKDLTQIALHGLPWENVVDYGAKADDATDCTAAFNAAIQAAGPDGSVYVPGGTYLINGQIEMNSTGVDTPGWGLAWPSRLFGDGRQHSILHIPESAISSQTQATIHAAVGVTITDLGFAYDQPEVATYSTLNQYKPVIKVNINYRTISPTPIKDLGARFMRLRIERAWDGIQALGSATGTASMGRDIFEDIEISMFGTGFNLDGYASITRMDKIHLFPFGMNTSQTNAWQLQNHSIGLYVGNHPYLLITNSVFLNGTGVQTHPSTLPNWLGGGPFLHFLNCKWDTFSVVRIGEGSPNQGGSSFTQCAFGAGGVTAITGSIVNIYYGPAQFTGCVFANLGGGVMDGPLLNNQSAFPVELVGCEFRMADKNQTAILSNGATIQITGCNFNRTDQITPYTLPAIWVTSGKAIVIGNCCDETITGSGPFLNLDNDEYHTVSSNNARGWTFSWPAGSTKVQAFGNQTGVKIGSNGQNQALGVKQIYLEGGSSANLRLLSGSGSPEGVVTADPGSLYLDTSISSAGNYAKFTGTGNTGWIATGSGASSGGGTPGGLTTQIQFNDAGAFGGDADLAWNKTSNLLSITGQETISFNNNDYTNAGGANSHLLLWNNSGSQNAVTSYIAGAVRAKWRTDSSGNISWVSTATAANTGHHFFLGGDYGAGLDALFISYSEAATQTPNNWKYAWTSGSGIPAIASGGIDTALGRNGAGIVEINNGTAGTFRDLKARNIAAQTGGAITGSGSVPTGGAAGQVLKKNTTTDYDVLWGTVTGGTGDLNFVFTQVSPSASWAVAHNLGKFPSVSVVDSGGTEIIPNVLYVDNNNVTISFGSATSGKAYIN